MMGGDSFVFFSPSLPTSKPCDVLPAYLVPNTCLPSLGGFSKEYRQQIPPCKRANRAAHVTDTLLQASREVSKQPAGQAVSNSSEPAASLYGPSLGVGPLARALPRLRCWHLPRMLIWHTGTTKESSAQEGQTPRRGCLLGLAMEGGTDFGARI